jgi:hypothetical protein
MAKKCVLVSSCIPAADLQPPVNWAICIFCQSQTREKLQCPSNALLSNNEAGYESLGGILPEFSKLGLLPSHLNLLSVDTCNGFVAALKENC